MTSGKYRRDKIWKEINPNFGMSGKKHTKSTIKKISDTKIREYKEGKVKLSSSCFKKGYKFWLGKKRLNMEGKNNPSKRKEVREKLRKHRATQVFPTKDTKIEVKIQNFLKRLGVKFFTHQYMKIEHGYQCDILIPSMNMVIECDGDYWHKYPIGTKLDHTRTKELLKEGFKVLRLWEREINNLSLKKFKEKIQ